MKVLVFKLLKVRQIGKNVKILERRTVEISFLVSPFDYLIANGNDTGNREILLGPSSDSCDSHAIRLSI